MMTAPITIQPYPLPPDPWRNPGIVPPWLQQPQPVKPPTQLVVGELAHDLERVGHAWHRCDGGDVALRVKLAVDHLDRPARFGLVEPKADRSEHELVVVENGNPEYRGAHHDR